MASSPDEVMLKAGVISREKFFRLFLDLLSIGELANDEK